MMTLRNSLAAFLSIFLFVSCDRVVVNSSENDELIASVADLPGGPEFKAIVPSIIQKCAGCHTHQAWYGFGEVDYLAAGLLVPGNYVTSKMYYRLSSSTEGGGPKNMPQSGLAAFSEEEVELMQNWITTY